MIKFLKFFTESIAWLQIMAAPSLAGLIIGALVYFSNPNPLRLMLGIAIAAAGLVAGAVWATRVWKKRGTVDFMSRVNASPDLNNPVQE